MFPCRQWITIPIQTCLLSLNRLLNSVGFFLSPSFVLFTFQDKLQSHWPQYDRKQDVNPILILIWSLLPIYNTIYPKSGFSVPPWMNWGLKSDMVPTPKWRAAHHVQDSLFDCSSYVLSGLSYLLRRLLQALFYYLLKLTEEKVNEPRTNKIASNFWMN